MTHTICFEICAESLESAMVAEAGGADSVELCCQLALSGMTPAPRVMVETVRALSIPVHVLIRPRGGDFVYSEAEFHLMEEETRAAKSAGAAGIAIGFLLPDGSIDLDRTRRMVALAAPMEVTFHRAFDEAADLEQALEEIISCGVNRLLTSGGKPTAHQGSAEIAALDKQARGRIRIMAGGGLTLCNLLAVARATGVSSFHGSMIRKKDLVPETTGNFGIMGNPARAPKMPSQYPGVAAEPLGSVALEDVCEAIRLLRGSHHSELDPQFVS